MMLYISIKFYENILNVLVFKVWSGHEFTIDEFQRRITPKLYAQELRILCSARRLKMFHISMKFHENILNGYRADTFRDGRTYRRIDNRGKNNMFPSLLGGDIMKAAQDDSTGYSMP